MMDDAKDKALMNLQHRGDARKTTARGYAMAGLLVSLAVMGVLMSVAMPVWRQAAQREKEAELVFRGEQYARAIGLFSRKNGGAFPPNLDILVEQRFLRRKFKDPMLKDGEFLPLYADSQRGDQPTAREGQTGANRQSESSFTALGGQGRATFQVTPAQSGRGTLGPRGGVIGVASQSKEKSIRLYKGRGQYDQWQFIYIPVSTQPGAAPPGGGTGPGLPGGVPGQPGRPGQRPGTGPPGRPRRGEGEEIIFEFDRRRGSPDGPPGRRIFEVGPRPPGRPGRPPD
jgi:type II secretory pathway pseudopilin PulG